MQRSGPNIYAMTCTFFLSVHDLYLLDHHVYTVALRSEIGLVLFLSIAFNMWVIGEIQIYG